MNGSVIPSVPSTKFFTQKVKRKVVFVKFLGYHKSYEFAPIKFLLTADLFPGIIRRSKTPIPLPTRFKSFVLLDSPFKHKKAQSHYEIRTLQSLVWFEAKPDDARRFLKFVTEPGFLPKGTNYRIVEQDFEDLDNYYTHPAFVEQAFKEKVEESPTDYKIVSKNLGELDELDATLEEEERKFQEKMADFKLEVVEKKTYYDLEELEKLDSEASEDLEDLEEDLEDLD